MTAPQGGVARQATRAASAILVRQLVVQGSNVATAIFLARTLSPADYGVYAITTFVLAFLTAFGDVGLAASLVRQPQEPAEREYAAVFTAQQALLLAVALLVGLAAPALARLYHLPPSGEALFRLSGLAVLITGWGVIPSVRLERRLEFGRLALAEVTQALVFNGAVIALVLSGAGVTSFGLALVARALAGAAVISWASPWRPRLVVDPGLTRAHLRFGLPYQGVTLISLLKDSITPVLVGALYGTAAVGQIAWAQATAAYPVMVLMILQRLYLPVFARVQDRPDAPRLLERVVWLTNAVVAPLAIVTLVLAVPITALVLGRQWLPSLPLMAVFWGANLLMPTAAPAMAMFNARGRSRVSLLFAVIWMAGTWAAGLPLILAYGVVGFAWANLAVQLTNIALFVMLERELGYRFYRTAYRPWLSAALMGAALFGVARQTGVTTLPALAGLAGAGLLVYGLLLFSLNRPEVQYVVQTMRRPRAT